MLIKSIGNCRNCPAANINLIIVLSPSFACHYRGPAGYDRTRNAVIGNKNFDLTYLEEAYTSEHWLVRIYRVKKPDEFNRPVLSSADRVVPSSDYITKKVSLMVQVELRKVNFK